MFPHFGEESILKILITEVIFLNDRLFQTTQGLKQHHSTYHFAAESLPQLIHSIVFILEAAATSFLVSRGHQEREINRDQRCKFYVVLASDINKCFR